MSNPYPRHQFKESYFTEIVAKCAQGFSLGGFAGHIGVSRQTLYDWAKHNPRWAAAMKDAVTASQTYWEKRALALSVDKDAGNAATTIFALKCRGSEDWRETQHVETGGELIITTRILKGSDEARD